MSKDSTTAGQPGALSCSKGQQANPSRGSGDIVSPLYAGLAHVTQRTTRRGRLLRVDHFDVPAMSYEDGYRHGLRVAADALAWAAGAPAWPNPAAVLGDMVRAAVALESAGNTFSAQPSKRPAAYAFLRVMEEALRAAAVWGDWRQHADRMAAEFESTLASCHTMGGKRPRPAAANGASLERSQ